MTVIRRVKTIYFILMEHVYMYVASRPKSRIGFTRCLCIKGGTHMYVKHFGYISA